MNKYSLISCKDIAPTGVIGKQLGAQLRGLSGNIHRLWDELGDNSAWLGGSGEAWERGPYYLTGIVPLAYLTDDKNLTERAERWINAILASARLDGSFGPLQNRDHWTRAIVAKAMVEYYDATRDGRVIVFLDNYFNYLYSVIDEEPPKYWGAARALEFLSPIALVYSVTKKEYLIDLAEKLREYSYDFIGLMNSFPYTKPMTKYTSKFIFNLGKNIGEPFDNLAKKSTREKKPQKRESILSFNRKSLVKLIMETHGVNLAHSIKYPVTYAAFCKNSDGYATFKTGIDTIRKYHGNAARVVSSDEHVSGNSPCQGIELCAVVETMYSLEQIGLICPEKEVFEHLEFLAYNTFPATFTADMSAHQYVQQPNQVAADVKRRQFFDTDRYANTFGLKPNYGCCAANMHSGFPNFANYLCLVGKDDLLFPVYGGCSIKTEIESKVIDITERTDYPFDDKIVFEIHEIPDDTKLRFRVIDNTDFSVSLNGKDVQVEGDFVSVRAHSGDTVIITAVPRLVSKTNPDGSVSMLYGNVLMSTKLEERERKLFGTPPFHDRAFTTLDKWNIAPLLRNGAPRIVDVKQMPSDDLPFENAPVEIIVEGIEITSWRLKKNSANIPDVIEKGATMPLVLVTYGCTRLRISQFPKIAVE